MKIKNERYEDEYETKLEGSYQCLVNLGLTSKVQNLTRAHRWSVGYSWISTHIHPSLSGSESWIPIGMISNSRRTRLSILFDLSTLNLNHIDHLLLRLDRSLNHFTWPWIMNLNPWNERLWAWLFWFDSWSLIQSMDSRSTVSSDLVLLTSSFPWFPWDHHHHHLNLDQNSIENSWPPCWLKTPFRSSHHIRFTQASWRNLGMIRYERFTIDSRAFNPTPTIV